MFAPLLARKRTDLVPPEAGADVEFDRLLRHEKWSGDPLFLMTAGLVAGSHGINNALSLNRTDLATIIAERELERIGALAAGMAGRPPAKRQAHLSARARAGLPPPC